MPKVRICTPLYSYTKNRSLVEVTGSSLDEVSRDLDRQFPGIRFRVIDEQEEIRPHVKFFVNGHQTFDLRSRVNPSDEIAIVQAFSGG